MRDRPRRLTKRSRGHNGRSSPRVRQRAPACLNSATLQLVTYRHIAEYQRGAVALHNMGADAVSADAEVWGGVRARPLRHDLGGFVVETVDRVGGAELQPTQRRQ